MGLLDIGSALAQVDQFKRRLGLLASDPSAFAASHGGAELGAAPSQTGGLLSVVPQVREDAITQAMQMTPGLLGATVYHGSQGVFDKFDPDMIGTGEGAQAYGYGHYVAENPRVAKFYRHQWWNKYEAQTPAGLRYGAKDMSTGYKAPLFESVAERDAWVKAHPGIYKIDLPDEAIAKMLDWDKPLSQQPQNVQDVMAAIDHPSFEAWKESGRWPTVTGKRLYEAIGGGKWGNKNLYGHMEASGMLSDAGIPGIKYLDYVSRKTGGGTRNFVIFPGNEGLLKILGRE